MQPSKHAPPPTNPLPELSRAHGIRNRFAQWAKNDFFTFLLIAVTLDFVATIAAPEGVLPHATLNLLQAVILVTTLRATGIRPRYFFGAVVLFVIAVTLSFGDFLLGANNARGLIDIIGLVLVTLLPLAVTVKIFRQAVVNIQTIFGALCVYIMVGLFFAFAYEVVGTFFPPFFANLPNPALKDYLYFSYVTLATLGYGDLAPMGNLPRALVVVEAVFGQLYLVTAVSLLVGNYRKRLGNP